MNLGMDLILLDRNENRYGPAPACHEVLRLAPPEMLFNYTRDFTKGYYSVLSRRLAEMHRVDEKRIVLAYGAEDLLKQIVHQTIRAGERCFIPSASWWYYRAIADEVEGVTVEYPIRERETTYEYDVDALMELHRRKRARLLLLSTPNNPTGNVFPRARLREVLDCFRDATVVLDQAYFGFDDRDSNDDVEALLDDHPNVVVLRTFSKLYALAGARIGYAVVGRGFDNFRKYSARNLGFNRISERLALAALDDPGYYSGIRARILRDRSRIVSTLRTFEGVNAYDSHANFVLARFPTAIVAETKAALLRRRLVLKFFDEPAFATCARITIGTETETTRLLDAFGEVLPALLTSRVA